MSGVKGVIGLVLSAVAIAVAAAGGVAVLDRLAVDARGADRRALLARQTELAARVLTPGSPLSCLDGGAGETVESACEQAVFVDASTTAAALAYTGARIALLKDAAALAQRGDGDIAAAFAGARRAVELDRFGFAAQVLADRDGCTPEQCPAFVLVSEAGALKANMKARVYDQYVSRHATTWGRAAPVAAPASPQASLASVPAVEPLPADAPPPATGHPVDSKWDFPSAASIPPVSIMNSEPPRPKLKEGADAQAAQAEGGVPVPPKRPQAQAPSATQAR